MRRGEGGGARDKTKTVFQLAQRFTIIVVCRLCSARFRPSVSARLDSYHTVYKRRTRAYTYLYVRLDDKSGRPGSGVNRIGKGRHKLSLGWAQNGWRMPMPMQARAAAIFTLGRKRNTRACANAKMCVYGACLYNRCYRGRVMNRGLFISCLCMQAGTLENLPSRSSGGNRGTDVRECTQPYDYAFRTLQSAMRFRPRLW